MELRDENGTSALLVDQYGLGIQAGSGEDVMSFSRVGGSLVTVAQSTSNSINRNDLVGAPAGYRGPGSRGQNQGQQCAHWNANGRPFGHNIPLFCASLCSQWYTHGLPAGVPMPPWCDFFASPPTLPPGTAAPTSTTGGGNSGGGNAGNPPPPQQCSKPYGFAGTGEQLCPATKPRCVATGGAPSLTNLGTCQDWPCTESWGGLPLGATECPPPVPNCVNAKCALTAG